MYIYILHINRKVGLSLSLWDFTFPGDAIHV